jgi:hypothetical protein
MADPKIPPLKFNKNVPFIFDRVDLPVRISLFPTGHLAVGIREYMNELGYEDIPIDLQLIVQNYLHTEWSAKIISVDDAETISTAVRKFADDWVAKNKKQKKNAKTPRA